MAPVGAGEIGGVVMSADQQPQPMRRAVVNLSGDALPDSRSVITDDAGRFAFGKLPAGSYTVTARKAAYLATEFGSPRPGRPGSRIALAAGEKRAISLTMFRGAAIAGTLRNPNGSPLSGVNVAALPARTIGRNDGPPSESVVTNDRGEYRIYGLAPGEYVVAATPKPGGSGEIGARSAADTDAIIARLTQNQNIANTTPARTPPVPHPPPPAVGYTAIYFPGTPLVTDAQRLRLAAGDDRNASFEVPRVPVATIEGTVSGDVPNLAAVQLAIIPEVTELLFGGGPDRDIPFTNVPPNGSGEFKYGNLPPGKYRLVARGRRATPPGEMLYAVAEVEVRGQDVKGLNLSLEPGGVISGMVVFDSIRSPAPTDFEGIRVGLAVAADTSYWVVGGMRIGNSLSDVAQTLVNPDGTFQITGIGPSLYTLACTLPGAFGPAWKLRSAIVDGRDLLDTNIVGPAVRLQRVMVTISDKRTEIAGSLLSAAGQPQADYYVIAFSTDRSTWRAGSRRSLSARPATNGRFVFTDPPAGEYFLAALTDLDPADWQDAAFLEQVAPAAIKISVAEGEKKTQDLRIR